MTSGLFQTASLAAMISSDIFFTLGIILKISTWDYERVVACIFFVLTPLGVYAYLDVRATLGSALNSPVEPFAAVLCVT